MQAKNFKPFAHVKKVGTGTDLILQAFPKNIQLVT